MAKPSSAYKQIEVSRIRPNTWNPNKLAPEFQTRLENGIIRLLEKSGAIPPIVVRAIPNAVEEYEIIDGFHRWKVFKKLKKELIDAFIVTVDDAQARILTDTLNYLRGEPDEGARAKMLAEILVGDSSLTVEKLAELIPKNADQLSDIIAGADLDVSTLASILERSAEEEKDEGEEERWVTMNFVLPLSVSVIIEKELDRIASSLSGKERRMRAFEYMAVNSSLTPLDSEKHQTVASQVRPAPEPKKKAEPVEEVEPPSAIEKLKEKAKAKLKRPA